MQAIEFETFISQGLISIPLQYHLHNVKAKVILLYQDAEQKGNYNKQFLLLAFSQAQQKGVFGTITNSVQWQQNIRNDWE
jgi:hypothetical protein